jgi:hypothetical protein
MRGDRSEIALIATVAALSSEKIPMQTTVLRNLAYERMG